MKPFFFYGSLRDKDLLSLVLGRSVDQDMYKGAILKGYKVVRLKNEIYPMLSVIPGGMVTGSLIEGLNENDLARIMFYESVEYRPSEIVVQTNTIGQLRASAFIGSSRALVDTRPWSFENWQVTEKPATLIEARVWMSFFGHCDIETADRIWDEWCDAGKPLADLEHSVSRLVGSDMQDIHPR